MTAKEYLQQYGKAEKRLFHLDEQLYILRSKMEKTGGLSDRPCVQSSPVNRIETLMEQYILREQAQESERHRCAEVMCGVRMAVAQVEDSMLKTLLEYRYLDGLEWDQVANVMGYTPEHVRREMHNSALRCVKFPT